MSSSSAFNFQAPSPASSPEYPERERDLTDFSAARRSQYQPPQPPQQPQHQQLRTTPLLGAILTTSEDMSEDYQAQQRHLSPDLFGPPVWDSGDGAGIGDGSDNGGNGNRRCVTTGRQMMQHHAAPAGAVAVSRLDARHQMQQYPQYQLQQPQQPQQQPKQPQQALHQFAQPPEAEFHYVTESVAVLTFGPHHAKQHHIGQQHQQQQQYWLAELAAQIQLTHNFKLFNLSEPQQELQVLCPQIRDFNWPEGLAPSLDSLCDLCKAVDAWTSSGSTNVAVVHCRGELGRLATFLMAYMYYCTTSMTSQQQRNDSRWLSIKRFHDDRLSLCTVPSQKRYVNYFAGLLSGSFHVSSRTVFLEQLLLHGLPRCADQVMQGHYFVKIYLNLSLVYASPVQSVVAQEAQADCLSVRVRPHLKLLGDVLIKLYFKRSLTAKSWDTLFRIQIPSYLITETVITLYKQDLDMACDNPNFPASSRVELKFNWTGRSQTAAEHHQATRDSDVNQAARWDSYEDVNQGYKFSLRTYEGQVNSVSSLTPIRSVTLPRSPPTVRPEPEDLDRLLEDLLVSTTRRPDIEQQQQLQQQQLQQQQYQYYHSPVSVTRQRTQQTATPNSLPAAPMAAAGAAVPAPVEPITERERLLLEELAKAQVQLKELRRAASVDAESAPLDSAVDPAGTGEQSWLAGRPNQRPKLRAASSFDHYDTGGSSATGATGAPGAGAGPSRRVDAGGGTRQRVRHHSAYQHGLASPQRVDNTGSFGSELVYGQSSSGLQLDYPTDSGTHIVGRGVHGVKTRAAQQRLRAAQQQQPPQQQQQQQYGSGPLSTNRMRTLTMSTPHLTDHPKHAHFNFVNHLAVRDTAAQRGTAAVRASSMEPAPLSHRQQRTQAAPPIVRGPASAHASPAPRRAGVGTTGGGIYGGAVGAVGRFRENGGSGGIGGTTRPGFRGHGASATLGGTAAAAAPTFASVPGSEEGMEAIVLGPPKFVTDTSPMWYLPDATREDAIHYLRPLPPGRFIVRDSHSYPGGYGLAVKVAEVPKGAPVRSEDRDTELVRHFLIEPTSKGVRLKGCPNEPVFASLAALIYQHTVTQLALPCKLMLPSDASPQPGRGPGLSDAQQPAIGMDPMQILAQGAACNVLYLGAVDLESLSGPGGIAKAVDVILRCKERLRTTECQFKVARDGITLTDTHRKLFFRKHFPTSCISHCSLDPYNRQFQSNETSRLQGSKIFGFIARKSSSGCDNTGVIVSEIEEYQPAEAVIKFVCKYLIGRGG